MPVRQDAWKHTDANASYWFSLQYWHLKQTSTVSEQSLEPQVATAQHTVGERFQVSKMASYHP